MQQEEDLNQKAVDLQKQRDELEKQQEQLNAQKVELQQVNTGDLFSSSSSPRVIDPDCRSELMKS